MSRDSFPSIPKIDPQQLRDHGTPERIDRVWERLERSVSLSQDGAAEPPLPRAPGRWPLIAAGIAAGFAIGIAVGGSFGERAPDDRSGAVVVAPADGEEVSEVFAAGTAERRYALPGGGMLSLQPGSIVDTVARRDGSLTLRLVRGEATLITPNDRVTGSPIALLVGNAELTPAGSLRVRHDGDTAMVQVIDGSASVSTPDPERGRRDIVLGPDDRETTVPVRIVTASNDEQKHPNRIHAPADPRSDELVEEPVAMVEEPLPEPIVVVPIKPWMEACKKGDDVEAARLLNQSGDSVADIEDVNLLTCIAGGQEILKRDGDAIASYERILNGSGSMSDKAVAARYLAKIYRRQGKLADADRYAAISDEFFNGSLLPAEGLCNKIQADDAAGNAESVREHGKRYLSQYPGGPCTRIVQALLEKHHAAEQPEAEPDDAEAPAEPDVYEDEAKKD